MKNTQFKILLAALAVTGGAAFWKYSQRTGAVGKPPAEIGQDVLKNFKPADVAGLVVRDTKGEVTVEQKDGKWIVPARDGFPASEEAIKELLKNAWALKIDEVQRVGDSRLGQLKLKKPGDGGTEEETGTLVSFRDSAGKEIKGFTAGKIISNDDTPPGGFSMSPTGPKSQYIKVAGEEGYVYRARDGFTRLETDVKSWLDKNSFFKIDKIKSVTVAGSSPADTWRLAREKEGDELKLEAPQPGEDFDAAKASSVATVFSWAQFVDVLPAADAARAELGKPLRTAVIETFDGLTYTIKVGASSEVNHYLSYTVEGKLQETRTPPPPGADGKPAETEEQKKTADEAFAKTLEERKKKLADEQAHQTRIFLLPKSSLEPILKKRADFMKDKPATGLSADELDNSPPKAPGTTPAPARIEAVTPPISVEIPPAKEETKPAPGEAQPAPPAPAPGGAPAAPSPAPASPAPAEPVPAPAEEPEPAGEPAPPPAPAPEPAPASPAPAEPPPASPAPEPAPAAPAEGN